MADATVERQPVRRLALALGAIGVGLVLAFTFATPLIALATVGLVLALANGYSKAYSP